MHRANQEARSKRGRIVHNKGLPAAARKLLVQKANQQTDILSLCAGVPLTYNVGDTTLSLEHKTAPESDQSLKQWLLDLTRENVMELYMDSGWGWSDEEKGKELWHNSAHNLLVYDPSKQKYIAFTNFRFDMDYGSHVLYCYEIHVTAGAQGAGIGAWLMEALHALAQAARMAKVVLTVGRNNPRAIRLYLDIGYRVDETSPASLTDVSSSAYLILSRPCKPVARDSDEQQPVIPQQDSSSKPNMVKNKNKRNKNKENRHMNVS